MHANSLEVAPVVDEALAAIVCADAIAFVTELHARFGARRDELLSSREGRGEPRAALDETREIRETDWQVAPPRADYEDRRVEITGPPDRKLVINALNSGAKGFMADFEDATTPTWHNQLTGHRNLIDAIDATIAYDAPDGRHYSLNADPARLLVRPRGWHLPERSVTASGIPVAGALVDFGLHAYHCARRLTEQGLGVYFYLPKLEHHLEARLWNDIFAFTEHALELGEHAIRATVLIETVPAAFQMHEMLYELRDRSAGLNAGRWDYIFSMIKSFAEHPEFVLPDRNDVKMTVPFMHGYTELLVRTCHARGAFAMGGMAALIPSRRDPEANERAIAAVRADKHREANAGFDGTWVAHADVVGEAMAEFDAVLGDRPNQIERRRDDVSTDTARLLDAGSAGNSITETGLRNNVNVALRYISVWLGGRGAVAINNLMEDAATAEICRSQIWQWIRHGALLDSGARVTRELVSQLIEEELAKLSATSGDPAWEQAHADDARAVFEHVALGDELPDFLTLPAYELLH